MRARGPARRGARQEACSRPRADETAPRPADLVERDFTAPAPEPPLGGRPDLRPHLVGLRLRRRSSSTSTRRFIVGWQAANHLRTDLALDALEMALWQRKGAGEGLVHHSDRGVQYLSIRYTERLAEAGIETSVGSRGDAYDNAMAEIVERPLQGRGDPPPRALEGLRRRRVRDAGMGRLVQQHAAA